MRPLSDYELNAIKAKYLTTGSKLSCAVYARKSKEDVSQQALNVQIDACMELIDENKQYLQHRKTYQEDNVSGYSIKGRDEFLSLLQATTDGFIDVVIASKWDRFSRNQVETEQLVNSFKDKGVILIIVDDSGIKDANSELFRRITRSISQYFVERVAEDTKAVLIKKAEQGFSAGGTPNYGYLAKRFDKNTVLVQDPLEAPIVLEIFNKTAVGYSYQEIIDELEARGVKTRKGNTFTRSTLNDILRNVKYKGTYRYNRADKKRSKIVLKDFEEVMAEDAIDDPIVSKELFDQVQVIMDGRKGIRTDTKYLFTGLAFCGYCGRQLSGSSQHSSKSKSRRLHYICPNHLKVNNKTCVNKGIDAATLEEQGKEIVYQYVLAYLKTRPKINNNSDDLLSIQIQSLNQQIKSFNKSIQNYQDNIDTAMERLLEVDNKTMKKKLEESILQKEATIRGFQAKVEQTTTTLEAFKSMLSNKKTTITKVQLFQSDEITSRLTKAIIQKVVVGEEVLFYTKENI